MVKPRLEQERPVLGRMVGLIAVLITVTSCAGLGTVRQSQGVVEKGAREHQVISSVGFIWGYLKYHHPYLYDDCVSWDVELVAVLKRIDATSGRHPVKSYVVDWIKRVRVTAVPVNFSPARVLTVAVASLVDHEAAKGRAGIAW